VDLLARNKPLPRLFRQFQRRWVFLHVLLDEHRLDAQSQLLVAFRVRQRVEVEHVVLPLQKARVRVHVDSGHLQQLRTALFERPRQPRLQRVGRGEPADDLVFPDALVECLDARAVAIHQLRRPCGLLVHHEEQSRFLRLHRPLVFELGDGDLLAIRNEPVAPGEDPDVDITGADVGEAAVQRTLVLGDVVLHGHVFVAEAPQHHLGDRPMLAEILKRGGDIRFRHRNTLRCLRAIRNAAKRHCRQRKKARWQTQTDR
jgi:hypothetical protein